MASLKLVQNLAPSILNPDEEAKLVQYAIHMTAIGYGRTKQQLQHLVKQIIQKDGQPNLLGICLARNGDSYLTASPRNL